MNCNVLEIGESFDDDVEGGTETVEIQALVMEIYVLNPICG